MVEDILNLFPVLDFEENHMLPVSAEVSVQTVDRGESWCFDYWKKNKIKRNRWRGRVDEELQMAATPCRGLLHISPIFRGRTNHPGPCLPVSHVYSSVVFSQRPLKASGWSSLAFVVPLGSACSKITLLSRLPLVIKTIIQAACQEFLYIVV